MITADLYDFDGTVFNGESGIEFLRFCIKRHPKLIKYLPKQAARALRMLFPNGNRSDKFKEKLYCYLKDIDAEREAELFWDENAHKMNDWFKPNEHDVPVVICSASPLFQIKPICDRLGVDLVIATELDPKTGKMSDKNCKGENKTEYIKKYAPEYVFRDVYTDNIVTDAPILKLASRNRYHVVDGKVSKI